MANDLYRIEAKASLESPQIDDGSCFLFTNSGLVFANMYKVDAVEVVRCEKCQYRSQYSNENGMYKCGGILTEDGDCFLMVKPDHFCAFGEHRGKDGRRNSYG